MTKGLRADLHERCAEWIEARPDAPPELDEILGHHLEQAHAYRVGARAGRPRRDGSRGSCGRATGSCGPESARPRRCARRGESPRPGRGSATWRRRAARRPLRGVLQDRRLRAGGGGELGRVRGGRGGRRCPQRDRRPTGLDADRPTRPRRGRRRRGRRRDQPRLAHLRGRRRRLDGGRACSSGLRTCTGGAVRSVRWRRPSSAHSSTPAAPATPASSRRSRSGSASRPCSARWRSTSAVLGWTSWSRAPRRRVRSRDSCSSRRACWPRWPATFDDARSRCREGKEILDALGRGVGAAAITTWTSAIELLGRRSRRRRTRAPARVRAAPGDRRAREPGFDRRAAGGGPARAGSLRGGAHRHVDERGSVLARRRPRADFVAGRAREGARPARPRPGGARDRQAPPWSSPARPTRRCSQPRPCLAVAEAHAAAGEAEEGRDAAGRAQQLFEAKGNVVAAGRARALSEELAARTALTRG